MRRTSTLRFTILKTMGQSENELLTVNCFLVCSTAPSYVAYISQKRSSHTRNTRSSSYTSLFSIDLHTVRQNLVISRLPLLLLLSGTLFQMMSGVVVVSSPHQSPRSLYTVYILTLDLLILSFNGFHLI